MKIIVTGCGTDVGKTVTSAILLQALQGEYWKPVECGDSDTAVIRQLLPSIKIHQPSCFFQNPVSPHQAARLEGKKIDARLLIPPENRNTLIMETAGGIFVPLNDEILTLDLFQKWDARWIIVSRHYLGSINHTLLTIEALKQKRCELVGIVFNGELNRESEQAILTFSGLTCIGRIRKEERITTHCIERYAEEWQQQLKTLLKTD